MLPLQWQLYLLLCIFWRALWRPGMTAASPKAGVVWDCWEQSLGRVLAVIRETGHGSPPWPFLGAVWLHYDIRAITDWEQNARTGVPSPHGPCSAAQSLFCWCPEQDGCGRQSWLSSLANLLSLAASCVPEGAPQPTLSGTCRDNLPFGVCWTNKVQARISGGLLCCVEVPGWKGMRNTSSQSSTQTRCECCLQSSFPNGKIKGNCSDWAAAAALLEVLCLVSLAPFASYGTTFLGVECFGDYASKDNFGPRSGLRQCQHTWQTCLTMM